MNRKSSRTKTRKRTTPSRRRKRLLRRLGLRRRGALFDRGEPGLSRERHTNCGNYAGSGGLRACFILAFRRLPSLSNPGEAQPSFRRGVFLWVPKSGVGSLRPGDRKRKPEIAASPDRTRSGKHKMSTSHLGVVKALNQRCKLRRETPSLRRHHESRYPENSKFFPSRPLLLHGHGLHHCD